MRCLGSKKRAYVAGSPSRASEERVRDAEEQLRLRLTRGSAMNALHSRPDARVPHWSRARTTYIAPESWLRYDYGNRTNNHNYVVTVEEGRKLSIDCIVLQHQVKYQ
jgi:hypothetical protein